MRAPVDAFRIVDGVGLQVPANVARRVDDGVFREAAPFDRTARRIVPDELTHLRGAPDEIVDEVETVLKLRIDALHFHVEGRVRLSGVAAHLHVDARGVDLVGVGEGFALAVVEAVVGDLDRVDVVGIEPEDRDPAVREKTPVAHGIGDLDAALLRDDADLGVFDRTAAVFDDGRQGRDLVGIHDDGAEVSLRLIGDLRAARAARGERG